MLDTFAAVTGFETGDFALMVVGGAACAWLPLSLVIKPMAKRRVLLGMCCALGLVTAGVKTFSGSSPGKASAAPQQEQSLVAETPSPTTQPTTAPSLVLTSTMQKPGARHDEKPQTVNLGDPRPQDAKNVAIKPLVTKPSADHDLADQHTDHTNGYSIRFPAGWTSTQFAGGDPWFIEVSDGKTGLISVGFSPFAATAGIDQLNPTKLATHLAQKRTTVQGHGYGTIDGQPCIWLKYTGPIKGAIGEQPMTVIHYFVPLHDGRMFELRMASIPELFAKMGPILKKSAASVKLLPA